MRTRVGKSMVRAAFQCALLTGIVAQLRASGQVSEQMLKDDPRLDRRISCERKRTRLGELMEELTKQSGVRVSVRDVDNLSGVFVTICVKDERLADVLDAVWSLTSSFDGKCIVSRSGVAGDFAYELSESLRTKNRAVLVTVQS